MVRVTVFGPGGVGGFLAARLAASDLAEVSVVARGTHLDAIRREGLRLASVDGDLHVTPVATDEPAEIGPVDLVLLTVKSTDVAAAAARLGPLIGTRTAVITLQNGVDSPRQVAAAVGDAVVLPGVAYIFSTVAAPGLIRHTAGPGRFVFGPTAATPQGRAEEVGDFLAAAGVEHEVVADVEVALWSKFALICATAGATAPSRLPIDILREDPAAWRLFEDLARETIAVGRAHGVDLPDDTTDRVLGFIRDIGPGAYSSLLYDLVHGKPMELETLHGAVVRLAAEVGVDVPVSRTVHALLSAWAARNRTGLAPDTVDGTSALTR